jgi:bacteriocin-like protein
MKKQTSQRTHLSMDTLTERRKRLGEKELSEAELKVISGGYVSKSQGGTCTTCGDCDE